LFLVTEAFFNAQCWLRILSSFYTYPSILPRLWIRSQVGHTLRITGYETKGTYIGIVVLDYPGIACSIGKLLKWPVCSCVGNIDDIAAMMLGIPRDGVLTQNVVDDCIGSPAGYLATWSGSTRGG
jgi:hypothetical protein